MDGWIDWLIDWLVDWLVSVETVEKESSGAEDEEENEPGIFEIPIFTEEFLDHNKGSPVKSSLIEDSIFVTSFCIM